MHKAMQNARCAEVIDLQVAVSTDVYARSNSTQRAWQQLPRHLRRRAASHDVRRVPLRLREKAQAEVREDTYLTVLMLIVCLPKDGPCAKKGC